MKFDVKTVSGIALAVVAGVATFLTKIDDQKRDQEFEEMKDRLAKLEAKDEE